MAVHQFPGKIKSTSDIASGGEPPYDDGMENRVKKLEEISEKTLNRLTELERDMAVIKSNYSTKSDVSEAKNSIIMWVVSAVLLAQVLPGILKKFGL